MEEREDRVRKLIYNFINIAICTFSVLFTVICQLIKLFSISKATVGTYEALAILGFFAFAFALAGAIMHVIPMLKNRKFNFNVVTFVTLITLFLLVV